jgi:hypothetical protein
MTPSNNGNNSVTLPVGWDTRNNQISEHDRKLGAAAAANFASKNSYGDNPSAYKNSEEVKAFYMNKIEQELQEQQQQNNQDDNTGRKSSLPVGWEDRQKNRQLQAEQYGAFSRNSSQPLPGHILQAPPQQSFSSSRTPPSVTVSSSSSTAEEALVKVATHTLDSMAQALENNPVHLSPEDRAAFAAAMQRAMTVIAKCR